MRWVPVLTSGTVRTRAAEFTVEGNIRASEGSEGEFPGREVEAEAAVRGVAEIVAEFLGSVSARALFSVDVVCEEGGRECGRVVRLR